jgi:hypothetical protein
MRKKWAEPTASERACLIVKCPRPASGLLAINSRVLGHTKTVKEYLWAGMIVSKAEAHPSYTAALEKTHFHQFDWERRLIGLKSVWQFSESAHSRNPAHNSHTEAK